MDFFSLLGFGRSQQQQGRRKSGPKGPGSEPKAHRPEFDALEERVVLSCNSISGYVYQDANSNGTFDAGEVAIADSEVELRDAAGGVVATAVTDANGYYEFHSDQTRDTSVQSIEQTVAIPSTLAGFSLSKMIDQFDPSLGELLEVEVTNEGAITSAIKAENSSTLATANITAIVSGSLTLTAPGVALVSTVTQNAGNFSASRYDGATDFAGTSGKTFAPVTATADPKSVTLTGNDTQAYVGTGQVEFVQDVDVNSSASGGGNLMVGIASEAAATIKVVYKYKPHDCLTPGPYTIVQKQQPPGLLDGPESRGDTVLPGTVGTDTIPVTLGGEDLPDNNFGEVAPASVSGHVYFDQNDNGAREADLVNGQPREPGIAGVTVTLSGTDDQGQDVLLSTVTGADGSYSFVNLRPGTYTLTETQPSGYLDGLDAAGSQGGTVGDDVISEIALAAGSEGEDYDFGEGLAGSLSGYVYRDAGNDGVKGAGEPGIAGVTLTLTGTDSRGAAVTRTATTLADGSYTFTGLRAGTYAIEEAQPDGYLDGKDTIGSQGGVVGDDVLSAIALGAGVNGHDNNFGEVRAAALSGYVYHDANNNGVKDAGEAGIGGATVTLTGTDDGGAVNTFAQTAADGSYSFANLRPGTYTLQETQPDGYLDGKDAAGTPGGTVTDDAVSNIVLGEGVQGAGHNFGEVLGSSLSGFVYSDLDNDGIKDATEHGIGGAAVRLTGTDDRGQPVDRTVNTDSDGAYSFAGLRPGTYALEETQPQGYDDGKDTIGTQGGTPANDRFSAIALGQNVDGTDNNFGEQARTSLSGYVYHDANNNGVKDPGEAGIAGVTVQLTGETLVGTQSVGARQVTTDANGAYLFDKLLPGVYTVKETQPGQYLDGKDSLGSLGGDDSQNDEFSGVEIQEGEAGTEYNFGEVRGSTLSGFVYKDLNNNGVKDQGEAGIAGVAVHLTGTTDGGEVTADGVTGADGSYRFSDLAPGTYSVTEDQPDGYADGKDTAGTAGGTAGDDEITGIALGQGVTAANNNFGELPYGRLSGNVYHDADDDGVKDAGESGIAGVKVTLTGTTVNGEAVDQESTTGADGSYSFQNLTPGTYTLTEEQPAGYADGKDTAGSLGGTVGADAVSAIALGAAQHGMNYNFGEVLGADVSIVKTASAGQVLAGGTVTYTLQVSNNGPSAAENVGVIDTLPDGMIFVSATAPGWTMDISGNTLSFTRGSMASGASSTITVTALAPVDAGSYTNTAVVSTTTRGDDPSNNTDDATVTVPEAPISEGPPPVIPQDPVPQNPLPSKAMLVSRTSWWDRYGR